MKLLLPLLVFLSISAFGSGHDECLEELKHGGIQAYKLCMVLQEGDTAKQLPGTVEPCAGTYEQCEGKEDAKYLPPFMCEEICRRALDEYLCYEQLCPELLYDF